MGRPTQHNHPPLASQAPRGEGQNDTRPLCDTRIPHPPRGGPAIRPGKRGGGHSGRDTPGLFPFRTRKLRLPAPMVLHPPGCGRVGHRRLHTTKGGARHGPPLFSRAPTHVRGHTATHAHGHAHTGHRETHHVRGHTRHGATHARPHAPQKPHPRQSSPHRTGSLSIGFGLGLSCGRMVLSVERGWACVGLLTASRALSALFAAEPLVSQSLDGPLSGRGCGSVVRVLTRV